jgi:hypothetical protein
MLRFFHTHNSWYNVKYSLVALTATLHIDPKRNSGYDPQIKVFLNRKYKKPSIIEAGKSILMPLCDGPNKYLAGYARQFPRYTVRLNYAMSGSFSLSPFPTEAY